MCEFREVDRSSVLFPKLAYAACLACNAPNAAKSQPIVLVLVLLLVLEYEDDDEYENEARVASEVKTDQ